jgi:ATPase subunit of ABC transporter with duplicated ATPase domains
MLSIKKINKSYGGKSILSDVSFDLARGQKIALIGYNGSGKSTLLKILAGLESPDSGSVNLAEEIKINYLPQEVNLSSNLTIEEYLKETAGLTKLEKKMRELESGLIKKEKLQEYGEIQQAYTALDGYSFEHRAKIILEGFGLNFDLNRPINSLSGGQKSKAMLTGLLLSKPNILLLDEPTNNLDLPAVIWLEKFLANNDSACLIVSHDRKFLDKIVEKTLEIDWFTRSINEYCGSYSDYLAFRRQKIDREKETIKLQQREKKRLIESLRDKKQWAAQGAMQVPSDNDKYLKGFRRDRATKSSKRAKTMEKQLERMGEIKTTPERISLEIPLIANKSEPKHSILLDGVKFSYPDGFSLGPITINIEYGSRVGILGLNGVGKTTLLKLITAELKPQAGKIQIGKSLTIGNLTQAHENLPHEKTISAFLSNEHGIGKEKVFLLLDKFNFNADDAQKKVGTLSPGERARLLLLLFSAQSINTLILDEPTNHLDLEALEALEEALENYTGTIIFVSHDRQFLEKIKPNNLYSLSAGQLKTISNYEEYLTSVKTNAERLIRLYKP